MEKKYFTVGPSEIFPEVIKYYNEAFDEKLYAISHRSFQFQEIYKSTVENLKIFLNIPDDFHVLFLSSATECMERIIQNLVIEKSYHFVNGYFAQRFFDFAELLGKKPYLNKSDFDKNIDFNSVIPDDAEIICLTHNETSTGAALDLSEIYRLKNKHKDKIFTLDIVTSVPYYEIDFTYIDVAFFSVQKGFGMPPGLGVMIVKKDLIDKVNLLKNKGISIGTYNNFYKLFSYAEKNQTTMTPNILAIKILGRITEFLLINGLEIIKKETEKKADMLYSFFERHPNIKPYIKDTNIRSKTTITLETELDTEKIHTKLEYNGYKISKGYDDFKDKHLRIANFPVHSMKDLSELIYLFRKF